jgi:Predicted ester cyclase
MSAEENKAVVRRFIEAYNDRNLELFDDLVAPDYVDGTHRQRGRDNFKQLFTLAFEAFPDWHEQIEEMIAEGDMVWVRVTATGTHTGEWSLSGVPIPPTGRKLAMQMVFIWRVVNGRLAEGREVDDSVEFLRQLGLLEYTAKGNKVFEEDAG